MALSQMSDEVGRVLGGRYRLVAPIGTGASARVFLADDVTLRRRVAVKLLHPALADDDAFLRRFRAEAQAAASLNNPHVLGVYDWGHDDGPYLVTEYLAGGNLQSMLAAQGTLTPSQALLVGLESARGLEYAHGEGLIHRDIKPANLLFDDKERLRIADFGLARALAEAGWTEPAGALVGTARYAAPEQARGERLGPRADVYSLALVINEMVSGSVPFAADTTVATLMARLDQPLEPTELLGPLQSIVARAGSIDPDDRPDAAEFAREMMGVAGLLPRPEPLPLAGAIATDGAVGALSDPTSMGTVHGAASAPPKPPPQSSAPPAVEIDDGTDGRRWPWVLLTLLVMAGAVAGGVVLWLANQPETAAVPALVGLTEDDATGQVAEFNWELDIRRVREVDTVAGEVVRTEPDEGVELEEGDLLRLFVSSGEPLVRVPTIEGLNIVEARAELEAVGLTLGELVDEFSEDVPDRTVISVELEPGQVELETGSAVDVVVSRGPEPRSVPALPEDGDPETAILAIEAERLVAVTGEPEFSEEVPAGEVIRFEPAAGEEVAADSTVTIIVSDGRAPRIVPNVIGLSVEDARDALTAEGFEVEFGTGNLDDDVIASDPAADTELPFGSTVVIATRLPGGDDD